MDNVTIANFNETLGQLYAYRHSNTSVTLGTRLAMTEDPVLVTAVGISATANGEYRCVVENFANGTSESLVRITTVNQIGKMSVDRGSVPKRIVCF